jgi:hypothetical protein
MTIDAIRKHATGTSTGNLMSSSDVTSSSRVARAQRTQEGRELFADGMEPRTAMTHATNQQVQPTSIVGDLIGGVVGGIGSLVMGVFDAIGDGLGALARGDILGAVANIPRGFINAGLGGFGLFTDVALGLFTTAVDAVLGMLRR